MQDVNDLNQQGMDEKASLGGVCLCLFTQVREGRKRVF